MHTLITYGWWALLICGCACLLQHVDGRDFSYNGRSGPEHWSEQYNTCNGKHQSPININILDVVNKPYWPIDITKFERRPSSGHLLNNGHTVLVEFKYDDGAPTISDGPLEGKGTYIFNQLHFHWGENNTVGSEDRINNITFPAELHMVFYNEQYPNFEEAVKHKDGIAVMAFFFGLHTKDNPHYIEFAELLQDIREPTLMAEFVQPPALKDLIVKDLNNYFTYTGSLTTPPCSEDVIWIDFATPILISSYQIECFRQLNTYHGKPLAHNYRPIQPLNNRTIFKPVSLPTFPFNQLVSSIPFVDRGNAAASVAGMSNVAAIAGIIAVATALRRVLL